MEREARELEKQSAVQAKKTPSTHSTFSSTYLNSNQVGMAIQRIQSGSNQPVQRRQDMMLLQRTIGNRAVAQLLEQAHKPEQATDTSTIHHLAAAGVQGTGGKLPHYDKIQASFGQHDVSHVQAYTGSTAAAASRSIGAEAYATGSKIAFAENNPSLHTAAHEATHIIQQQAGVQLKGGVGKAGDKYEQHADRVADAVVQGQSAENLLNENRDNSIIPSADPYKQSASTQAMPIQRKLLVGDRTVDDAAKEYENFQAMDPRVLAILEKWVSSTERNYEFDSQQAAYEAAAKIINPQANIDKPGTRLVFDKLAQIDLDESLISSVNMTEQVSSNKEDIKLSFKEGQQASILDLGRIEDDIDDKPGDAWKKRSKTLSSYLTPFFTAGLAIGGNMLAHANTKPATNLFTAGIVADHVKSLIDQIGNFLNLESQRDKGGYVAGTILLHSIRAWLEYQILSISTEEIAGSDTTKLSIDELLKETLKFALISLFMNLIQVFMDGWAEKTIAEDEEKNTPKDAALAIKDEESGLTGQEIAKTAKKMPGAQWKSVGEFTSNYISPIITIIISLVANILAYPYKSIVAILIIISSLVSNLISGLDEFGNHQNLKSKKENLTGYGSKALKLRLATTFFQLMMVIISIKKEDDAPADQALIPSLGIMIASIFIAFFLGILTSIQTYRNNKAVEAVDKAEKAAAQKEAKENAKLSIELKDIINQLSAKKNDEAAEEVNEDAIEINEGAIKFTKLDALFNEFLELATTKEREEFYKDNIEPNVKAPGTLEVFKIIIEAGKDLKLPNDVSQTHVILNTCWAFRFFKNLQHNTQMRDYYIKSIGQTLALDPDDNSPRIEFLRKAKNHIEGNINTDLASCIRWFVKDFFPLHFQNPKAEIGRQQGIEDIELGIQRLIDGENGKGQKRAIPHTFEYTNHLIFNSKDVPQDPEAYTIPDSDPDIRIAKDGASEKNEVPFLRTNLDKNNHLAVASESGPIDVKINGRNVESIGKQRKFKFDVDSQTGIPKVPYFTIAYGWQAQNPLFAIEAGRRGIWIKNERENDKQNYFFILKAVDVHTGGMNSGHWFGANLIGNKWIETNFADEKSIPNIETWIKNLTNKDTDMYFRFVPTNTKKP